MAAPGFAIPNILGNLAIAPGQVSKQVVAVKRNGGRKKRKVMLAKTVGMLKNLRSKTESRGESRISRLKMREGRDRKSTDEAALLTKGKGKALLGARPSNKAIMLNVGERGPMASNSNLSTEITKVQFPSLQQSNSETVSPLPHSPSAISLLVQSPRAWTRPKRTMSELSLTSITTPIPFKASQILGLETDLPHDPTPNLLEKSTSSPKRTQPGLQSEQSQLRTRSLSYQSLRSVPSRPKLQPVWEPRHNAESSNPIDTTIMERSASLDSILTSTSSISTITTPNKSSQKVSPPLPRKSPQRVPTPRHAGIIDGVLFSGTGSPNVQIRPVSENSSTYSEASVGTSILLGSNFHLDDLSVGRGDVDAMLPVGTALSETVSVSQSPKISSSNSNSVLGASTASAPTIMQHLPQNIGLVDENSRKVVENGVNGRRSPVTLASSLLSAMRSKESTEIQNELARVEYPATATKQVITPGYVSSANSTFNLIRNDSTLIAPSLPPSPFISTGPSSLSSPSKSLFTVRPPSNPVWLPRLDPSQEHTFIIVGEHTTTKKVLRIRLPCDMLEQHSRYLKTVVEVTKAVPAGHRSPIRFPDVEPRIFELWLRWIYFRDLTVHENTGKKNHKIRAPSIDTLLKAWELGKNLIDPTFQDACTDSIVQLSRSNYPPDFSRVKHVYNITNHGSGLRRLYLAMTCEDKLPAEWRRDDNIAIREIGEAAFADYKAERKESGRRWDRRREDKGRDSWRSGGCRFHEHGAMYNGVCGWRLRKSGFDDDNDDA